MTTEKAHLILFFHFVFGYVVPVSCLLHFSTMKRKIWTIGLLTLVLSLNAQKITKPVMGPGGLNAYSNKAPDLFSAFNNRAALARVKNKSLGIYGERRYLVEGLNNYLGMGAIETKSGCFGVQLGYFGFNRFNQSSAGLAYALALGSRMNLGVEFNYHSIRSEERRVGKECRYRWS